MADASIRGKSIIATAKDVANGFFTINPLTIKKFTPETIKGLHHHLKKTQVEVRGERFPLSDITALRKRNLRLQRLHQALAVLTHIAKERRVTL